MAGRNLRFRAIRTTATICATGAVFSLVVVMSALSAQFDIDVRRSVRAFKADAWVVAEGQGGPFTAVRTIPNSLAADLRARGADVAVPFHNQLKTIRLRGVDRLVRVAGVDTRTLGAPVLVAGRPATGPHEVTGPGEAGLRLGDGVEIEGERFEVVGLTRRLFMAGGTAILLIDAEEAKRKFFGGRDVASAIIVRGDVGEIPSGYQALTPENVWDDAFRTAGNIALAVDFVAVLMWFAGTALIGALGYVSSLERARDYSVLKAVGVGTSRILGTALTETLVVALLAAVLGSALAVVIAPRLPLAIELRVREFGLLFALSAAAGVVAAAGGVRTVAKADPALAFSAV